MRCHAIATFAFCYNALKAPWRGIWVSLKAQANLTVREERTSNMIKDSELPWTGERLVPSHMGDTAIEHLHRYVFARDYVHGKDVLDIACGEGYGSHILSGVAASVTGVDISPEVIEHARKRYGDKIAFNLGSCTTIPLSSGSVDVVVSYETLEHITEHDAMLKEVRRVLRPGGTLIISTPDTLHYSILPGFKNDYHVRELSKEQFRELIASYFSRFQVFEQKIIHGSIIAPTFGLTPAGVRHYLGDFDRVVHTDGIMSAPYNIAVATDGDGQSPPLASLFQGWNVPTEVEKQLLDAKDTYARSTSEFSGLLANAEAARVAEVERLRAEGRELASAHALAVAQLEARLAEVEAAGGAAADRMRAARLELEHSHAATVAQLEARLAELEPAPIPEKARRTDRALAKQVGRTAPAHSSVTRTADLGSPKTKDSKGSMHARSEASVPTDHTGPKIYAITMARNDCDLAAAFLAQAEELFDALLIVDAQSTDGTRELIAARAAQTDKIRPYSLRREEKYQSAIMNCLARVAFDEGADWIFFLDMDEFINVDGREGLERYLSSFNDSVMHLPWINLVPTKYGTFNSFDVSQKFFWNGRMSKYTKVALSSAFIADNPDFHVYEGSHTVSCGPLGEQPEAAREGLALLHLPIRSMERFKYKMNGARRTLLSKHNRSPGEGSHVLAISDFVNNGQQGDDRKLGAIAATYGDNDFQDGFDPVKDGWPTIRLGGYVKDKLTFEVPRVSLTETLLRDKTLAWVRSGFPAGSTVRGRVDGDELKIVPQPMKGNGKAVQTNFPRLPARESDDLATIGQTLWPDVISAAFLKIRFIGFSAWSELVPTLFCLFSIIRPRRYVDLGTHNGMSFFAACQAGEAMGLGTQCIAVDNWVGDPHASFHSEDVFNNFQQNIRELFPEQVYVRASFDQALDCFDDGSIDLLHIDGYHTYDAARHDLETWLPKMSDEGVVIFHDINVHEREFGVWRLWDELKEIYPSFSVFHSHGLGIVCVGSSRTVLVQVFEALRSDPRYKENVRVFLQRAGASSIEFRHAVAAAEGSRQHDNVQAVLARRDAEIARINAEFSNLCVVAGERDAELGRLRHETNERHAEIDRLRKELYPLLMDGQANGSGGQTASSGLLGGALRKRARRREVDSEVEIINNSGLFDRDYYLHENPDVAAAAKDPVRHYVLHGAAEGRNPSSQFNTMDYVTKHFSSSMRGRNPLVDFIEAGR